MAMIRNRPHADDGASVMGWAPGPNSYASAPSAPPGAGQPIVIRHVRGADQNWRLIGDLRALSVGIRRQTPRE
jgi:hypothetical protein